MMYFYPVSGFESDGFTFVAVTQLNKTRRLNSSRGKLTVCHKQYVAIITDYYLFATISHLWSSYDSLLPHTVLPLFYTVIILSGHVVITWLCDLTYLKRLTLQVQLRTKF